MLLKLYLTPKGPHFGHSSGYNLPLNVKNLGATQAIFNP